MLQSCLNTLKQYQPISVLMPRCDSSQPHSGEYSCSSIRYTLHATCRPLLIDELLPHTIMAQSMCVTGIWHAHLVCRHAGQVDVLALDRRTLLVAFNDATDSRSFLTLATSCDNGHAWTRAAVLEDDPEGSFSYTTMQDLPAHLCANYSNAPGIYHASVSMAL